jgi:hypothetical protein
MSILGESGRFGFLRGEKALLLVSDLKSRRDAPL